MFEMSDEKLINKVEELVLKGELIDQIERKLENAKIIYNKELFKDLKRFYKRRENKVSEEELKSRTIDLLISGKYTEKQIIAIFDFNYPDGYNKVFVQQLIKEYSRNNKPTDREEEDYEL